MVEKNQPPAPGGPRDPASARKAADEGARIPPWTRRVKIGDLGDIERQVLECLGAAVVTGWNTLPTEVQRALFQHAAAGETYEPGELRTQIARFLHLHKDDTDTP